MNTEKIGIIKGHTVTKAMIICAKEAGLPAEAINELWQTRTLNKKAIAAIDAAIKTSKAKKPTKQNETESEDVKL
tara:strand:- start:457 stop:681 length:225 start_codon:yes stop_codon:yes gene_type:complete